MQTRDNSYIDTYNFLKNKIKSYAYTNFFMLVIYMAGVLYAIIAFYKIFWVKHMKTRFIRFVWFVEKLISGLFVWIPKNLKKINLLLNRLISLRRALWRSNQHILCALRSSRPRCYYFVFIQKQENSMQLAKAIKNFIFHCEFEKILVKKHYKPTKRIWNS